MNPAEIQALARLAGDMDYYCLLRIEQKATREEIKRAYYSARRAFHPDRYLGDPSDVQRSVDQISRRVNEAWIVLRDSVRRPVYDRGLADGKLRYTLEDEDARQEESRARSGRTPNGRRFFQLAQEAEARDEIARAIAHLLTAITFESDNPAFREQLARLRARREPDAGNAKKRRLIR